MSSAPPPPPTGGAAGYGGAGAPRNDTKAVLALVLGVAGVLLGWCCFLFGAASIAAIILGRISEREIAASRGALSGAGMARAGFVLGIVGLVLTLVALAVSIYLFATGAGGFDFYVDPR
jgi:hypothetical protein